MEIVRLNAKDYDELLAFYNLVFTKQNQRLMDFTHELPRMWIRDDEHMSKHFAVKEDDKILAALGVYPLYTDINGEKFVFSTVGNVATHPDYEGRGYMKALMAKAMQELIRIKADASRLGGLRQRYNRYGYEYCGSAIRFVFTGRNNDICCLDVQKDLKFYEVQPDDITELKQIAEWKEKQKIYVEYDGDNKLRDIYLSLRSWDNRVFIAKDKAGMNIGYVCAFPDSGTLSSVGAKDESALLETICSWQRFVRKTVEFVLAPYQVKEISIFSDICESYTIGSPSLFKIINWEKTTNALMKLKSSYSVMPDGEFVLGIKDYGTIRLFVKNGIAGCEKSDVTPEMIVDELSAARLLFGPLSADCFELHNSVNGWFPLPLSWDMQDRV